MTSVVIQAGGSSTRMGQDKALINLGGKPLLQHILEVVSGLGDELVVITNSPDDFDLPGVRLASDPVPGQGALRGLETALTAAGHSQVLLVACDMPFLSRPLLDYLLQLDPAADLVIPLRGENYEPMHAVYHQNCLPWIRRALDGGERRMISFFDSIIVRPVGEDELRRFDPAGHSFFNVNTPHDLQVAEEIYARRRSQ